MGYLLQEMGDSLNSSNGEISWETTLGMLSRLDFPPTLDEKFDYLPLTNSISFSESISDLMKTARVVEHRKFSYLENVEADKIKSNRVLVY